MRAFVFVKESTLNRLLLFYVKDEFKMELRKGSEDSFSAALVALPVRFLSSEISMVSA